MEEAMKWITRERVKVDRVACPWLIKHFVDKDAEFVFVPPDKVMDEAKRLDAIPYDIKNVELGHHGKECSFEAILKKYKLTADRASSSSARSSTARIPTTRCTSSRKVRVWRPSPKAFAISATKTITRSMPRNGSSTTRSMPIARKWCGRESPTACLSGGDRPGHADVNKKFKHCDSAEMQVAPAAQAFHRPTRCNSTAIASS